VCHACCKSRHNGDRSAVLLVNVLNIQGWDVLTDFCMGFLLHATAVSVLVLRYCKTSLIYFCCWMQFLTCHGMECTDLESVVCVKDRNLTSECK
jgi:hypothetical protein